jgi:hypothetical protein
MNCLCVEIEKINALAQKFLKLVVVLAHKMFKQLNGLYGFETHSSSFALNAFSEKKCSGLVQNGLPDGVFSNQNSQHE